MSTPIIAIKDRTAVRQMVAAPPHALLIIAETGLDGIGTAEHIAAATPSDIFRIQPLEKSSSITTDQIRNLTASLRTHSPTRRIIIITPAESMTETAQNALLKTLEEPAPHTHFILVTTNADHMLPTVRSRCQTLQLHRTSPSQDASLLEKTTITDAERRQISFLAAGRPLLMKELAQNPQRLATYQALATNAKRILSPPRPYDALAAALSYNTRDDALALISILLDFITFQLRTHPTDRQLHIMADRVIAAETALRANGNVRLALAKLVI